MGHAKRIAKNSVFQAAAFAAKGLTEFLVGLFLARSVGAERLGELTTLITLAGLFAFISAYGFPSLLTREIARRRHDPAQASQLIRAALGLVALLSVVAVALMLVLGIVSGYSGIVLRALLLTGLALACESMAMVTTAAFRGIEELKWSSAVSAAMDLAFLGLAGAVIVVDARIDWLMTAYLGSRMIALGAAIAFYSSRFGRWRPIADLNMWSTLLKMGLPFSINSVFAFAYSRVDVIILAYLAGSTAVGLYDIAYGVTMRLNLVARAMTFAFYPFLAAEYVKDARAMRGYAAKGMSSLMIAGCLIAAMLVVFGRELLRLLYGAEFAAAASGALQLLALAVPLRFLETLLGVSLEASNRAGKRATSVVIGAIVNVVLNLALIPTYHMMGAVYATLATEVMMIAIFVWFLRAEMLEMIPWRALVAPGLGSVVVLSGLLFFNTINLWLLAILSVVMYVMTILAVDPSAVEPLRQIAAKRRL